MSTGRYNDLSWASFNENRMELKRLWEEKRPGYFPFLLMGFLNDEINLNGLSDTQQYKLAGNGWEINVASKVLKELLKL